MAALACLGCASSSSVPAARSPASAPAPAPATGGYDNEFVYVTGPGDLDCPGEIERARGQGEPGKVFLAEFRCGVNSGWKCPGACRADELLVTHVALRLDRQGQLQESRVMKASERADFDQMSVAAVKAAAPLPPPPPRMVDGAGIAAFNVELACDCARRARSP